MTYNKKICPRCGIKFIGTNESACDSCIQEMRWRGCIIPTSPSVSANPNRGLGLQASLYRSFGSVAQDIYIRFCDEFGWNYRLSEKYGPRMKLFAKNATKEGYAVWFLPHSNLTDTETSIWKNWLSEDGLILEERWDRIAEDLYSEDVRVTFIKKDNEYYFIGLFAVESLKNATEGIGYIKKYKRISDCYEVKE